MPQRLEYPDQLRDPERLAALQQLGLLDSPPDPAFDRLTRLAATVIGTPIALVSLVDRERQFFKSAFGLSGPWRSQRQTPLPYSFCKHVVATGQPLAIEDAREHPLTRDNRAVIEYELIAYLGVPLVTEAGHVLGALCVLDIRPRSWSQAEIEILTDLAASVMSEIKLIARQVTIPEPAGEGTIGLCRSGRCTFINPVAAEMLGYTAGEMVGQSMHDLVHRGRYELNPLPGNACPMCQALQAKQTVQLADQVLWRRDGTSFRADYMVYPVIQHGVVTGSIATFVDTTERQQAREARRAHRQALAEAEYERDRLQRLVAQAPIFCYVSGPEHIYTLANDSYRRVIGGRDPIGKPLREVLPEIESQGIIALLDRVFTTGEPFTGIEMPVMIDRNGDGTLEECFFTFLYQPDIGQDGKIDGIAVYGFEVTEQVRARRDTEASVRPGGERIELLAEVSHLFAEAAFDQQAILETAARYGAGQTGDTCAIRLLSEDDKWLVPVALYPTTPGTRHHVRAWLTGSSLPVDTKHGLWRTQADQPLSIQEYTPEEYRATIGRAARFMEQLGTQSILVVPLRARNQVVGLMSVLRDAQASPFSIEDQRFLQALADRTALALVNARLFQQLGERRQQYQALVGRLLLAQEKERQRLAYELHEDLAQIAASAYQHLQAYAGRQPMPPASDDLDQTAELMRRTIQEARRIVTELRPTVLDDFGLSAAIRLQVEELRATGWQINYREATRIERLPAMVETAIFRFVQEALQNVRKHAGTTHVEILLEQTDQSIRMEVQDRGRGFTPEASISQQVGLASIRAWVDLLGGEFLLDSRPGGGTRLRAEIPLRDD